MEPSSGQDDYSKGTCTEVVEVTQLQMLEPNELLSNGVRSRCRLGLVVVRVNL